MLAIYNLSVLWLLCCIYNCCWTPTPSAATEATHNDVNTKGDNRIKVFTVATEPVDGYLRYICSAQGYGIEVITLGMGEEWRGGDMAFMGGGAFKIRLLREAIKAYRNEKETVILFTDSYDVVFTTGLKEIYQKFKGTGAKVLFSAEKCCSPDESLAEKYPQTSEPNASRFLNSGGFIGYAPQVYAILQGDIKDDEDDQLFFTHVFLREDLRSKYGIMLDTHSQLFQNLYDAKSDIDINVDLETNVSILENIKFMTKPSILHGNGESKLQLNAYANRLAKPNTGYCLICQEKPMKLIENNLPTISLTILVTQPVPFFDMFLQKIDNLNYPKNKIHLFVYCNQLFHDGMVESFIKRLGSEYLSTISLISSADEINEQRGRELALMQAQSTSSDYMLVVKANAHIDEPELLRKLLIINKQFVAPIFSTVNELLSNNRNDLTPYSYSYCSLPHDDGKKDSLVKLLSVPYVSSVYLIKNTAFKHIKYKHIDIYFDLLVWASIRSAGIFTYVINNPLFGHLVNTADFNTSVVRPDFYTLVSNGYDWTKKYIHPDFLEQLKPHTINAQPCPDVFWFPVVTEAFCDDLVAIAEDYGKWKTDLNKDPVPTHDVHLEMVGLGSLWVRFLESFILPMRKKNFMGPYNEPPKAPNSFVVRYHPDEQASLRPHHDTSTYTINLALNHVNIDYQGGGCHFLRYNCTVKETKKGWMIMHPGRVTHLHEGLPVINGTRYIMVSFIDP